MTIDPKSLEFSIKVSFLAYPFLFQSRDQVLNHLYCVLGNGYDWWDGRLQERCDDEKIAMVEKMLLEEVSEEEIRSWVKGKDDERNWRHEKVFQELKTKHGIDLDTPPLKKAPVTIYPVCDLCTIMNLPDNIWPDWLDGAEEAVHLMETMKSFDQKRTEENQRLVPIIRERIAALKTKQAAERS